MAETQTQGDAPVDERKRYTDIDGNEIEDPVIASFERELEDARVRADEDAIAEIQERYQTARDEKVKADNKRAKERRKNDS